MFLWWSSCTYHSFSPNSCARQQPLFHNIHLKLEFLGWEEWQQCWWHCSGGRKAAFSVALICMQAVMFTSRERRYCLPWNGSQASCREMTVNNYPSYTEQNKLLSMLSTKGKLCFLMRCCPACIDTTCMHLTCVPRAYS